jgi:hypothetical protein
MKVAAGHLKSTPVWNPPRLSPEFKAMLDDEAPVTSFQSH